MRQALILLAACAALSSSARVHAAGAALTASTACTNLKQAVTRAYNLQRSTTRTWHCDFAFGFNPALWVIELRSDRKCQGACGGWFAVRKDNGEIGRFDHNSGTMIPLTP